MRRLLLVLLWFGSGLIAQESRLPGDFNQFEALSHWADRMAEEAKKWIRASGFSNQQKQLLIDDLSKPLQQAEKSGAYFKGGCIVDPFRNRILFSSGFRSQVILSFRVTEGGYQIDRVSNMNWQ